MSLHRVRVIDLETTGSRPPAHDVCEIGCRTLSDDNGRWRVNETRGAILVNPGRAIPPVTMAVHGSGCRRRPPFGATLLPPSYSRKVESSPLRLIAPPSSNVFARRDCPVVHAGSARGNVRCGYGRAAPASPIRCYATGEMPAGLDPETGLPVHRAKCQTPMSRRIWIAVRAAASRR